MLDIRDFDYLLPKNLIAQKPTSPRDHSKLLIYDTQKDKIYFDRFYNLDKYLPKNSFLVLNDTKVVPARITLFRSVKMTDSAPGFPPASAPSKHQCALSGSLPPVPPVILPRVKVLFLVNEIIKNQTNEIRGYVDRKVEVGDKLYIDLFYCFKTMKQEGSIFTFEFDFSLKKLFALLEKKGTMPIPLYIKNTPLNERGLRRKYQTIFAEKHGSAAAPTASLHFTNRLFKKLKGQGIEKYFITLHVGLGTFAPITEKNIKEKKLHNEFYEISPETFQCINTLKQNGKKLVAVGTTVTRTLESVAKQLNSFFSKTDLFIFPPYKFQMVDCLITNFHLPKSSLMMLVEAFLQHKGTKRSLIDLYQIAIKKNFRFYSFGDVMMII